MSDDFQSNSSLFRSSSGLRNDLNLPPQLLQYLSPLFMNLTGEECMKLWCLVKGRAKPIGILIQRSGNVYDLTKAVKCEADIPDPTSNIIIWKLNESIPSPIPKNFLSEGQQVSDFATELEPPEALSEVFPQAPAQNHLHIVVTIQESARSSSDESQNLEPLSLNCFLLGDDLLPSRVFTVEVGKTKTVGALKDLIIQKQSFRLNHANALDLTVWKVSLPVGAIIPECVEEYEELSNVKKIASIFKEAPVDEHVHILVCAAPGRMYIGQTLPEVSRNDTVSALYLKLREYKFIQVRGTPATGKSSLCRLLAHHISIHEPTTDVFSIPVWHTKHVIAAGDWKEALKLRGWAEERKSVIILDEAQTSYNDADLWNNFFKSLHEYPSCSVIIFASYGSPSAQIKIRGTPIMIPVERKVTLRAIQYNDNLPAAGLLFTRKEFDELVSVKYQPPKYVFDISFFDSLFNLTEGHIGAITDFIDIIHKDNSYREIRNLPNPSYTWTRFLQHVSPRTLFESLCISTVFARGLPPTHILQDPNFVAVFEAVLRAGFVTEEQFTYPGEKDAILQCFSHGWLHSDLVHGSNGSGFCFPSSLHRWFVEWKLRGDTPSTPLNNTNLLDFVVTIIRMFSPRALATRRIGPAFVQSPPEAQFQDEFYRCCHEYSRGCFVTFPEFGTKTGRVDFYIPSKQWGIELLRDGDELQQHFIRFLPMGSYGALSDHIMLDFRTKFPKKPHPGILKLYHVVFSDNFKTVNILDNNLDEVLGGYFTLMSSS